MEIQKFGIKGQTINFDFLFYIVAIVTILENSKDSSEQYVRTVAFLRKGNSFGVSWQGVCPL